MGRHSGCAPCDKKRREKHHSGGRNNCGKCRQRLCDCRCAESSEETPLAIIQANFTPSTDPGVIATAKIPLSTDPEYRPEWNVCERREVVVRINTNLLGGSAAQTVIARIGVFYDVGPNQFYVIKDSQPFNVGAGQNTVFTTSLKTDLDKDRIILVELLYFSGETPAPGAGVTYIPPIPPATDITVSIFYSKKYPSEHGEHKRH